MESGSPDARYAIVEKVDKGWRSELVTVPYDHHGAADQARQQARSDWAIALRIGWIQES